MPISEEEQRRRCILNPAECLEGLTQEAALAETLANYRKDKSGATEEDYRTARGLLRDFSLSEPRAAKTPTEGL